METSSAGTRNLTSYDPAAEIRAAGWRVVLRPLPGGATEQYDRATCTVYVDPEAYAEDPEHALAHAAAHLCYDLDDLGSVMTPLQEACANSVAWLRLDREWV